jgi:hypothetical protein
MKTTPQTPHHTTPPHTTPHRTTPQTTQESLKHASLPRSPFASSHTSRGVLPGAVDLRGGCPPPSNPVAERVAERDALRSLTTASRAADAAPSARFGDAAWAILSLGCLPLLKGVPAPFAGVKSLSD